MTCNSSFLSIDIFSLWERGIKAR